MDTLLEAKRLYDLGFSIIWIKPKSKAPLKMGWTKGPRQTWKELKDSYRKGYNVGVRLGSTSHTILTNTHPYLGVIDCDVKERSEKALGELHEKLKKLFPKFLFSNPTVLSGRGNGSCHFYIKSNRPVSPTRLAQSEHKVKVKMPSVKASKYELEHLTEKELKEGFRFRAAWEISLMGEGQQVLLPPSIHPDTGNSYKWSIPFQWDKLFAYNTEEQKTPTSKITPEKDCNFKIVFRNPNEKELKCLEPEVWDTIVSGTNVSDRSASLFTVTSQMVKAGWDNDLILSVLTDNAYYLGGVGFDHAKTNNRVRAAQWISTYTLKKARIEADANLHFKENAEVENLNEKDAEIQKTEVLNKPWQEKLDKTDPKNGDKPKNTLKNVVLILENTTCKGLIRRNEFANTDTYGCDTPWGGKKGKEIEDMDIIRVKFWLASHFRFEPSDDRINQAFLKIADKNRFHPVRDYLDSLDWDGVPRLDTWLKRHLNAKGPTEYLEAVSRKILCAMVARVYQPGIKFDEVLILEGGQGLGKSTAVRHLASNEWFSDTHIDIKDKDAVLSLESVWVIELGELSSMRNAEAELLKNFLGRTTDRIRVPYGKRTQRFPRQCIFIGTTNAEEYFTDKSGNRRFWPIKVGAYDFKSILKERDQLLAEAKFTWEMGEPLFLDKIEMKIAAKAEQEKRMIEDSFSEILSIFFQKEKRKKSAERTLNLERFTMQDLFEDFGPLRGNKMDQITLKRAAEGLRKLNFVRSDKRIDGVVHKVWEPKRAMLPVRGATKTPTGNKKDE